MAFSSLRSDGKGRQGRKAADSRIPGRRGRRGQEKGGKQEGFFKKGISAQNLSYVYYIVFPKQRPISSCFQLSELKQTCWVVTSIFQGLNSFWVLVFPLSFSQVRLWPFGLRSLFACLFKIPFYLRYKAKATNF